MKHKNTYHQIKNWTQISLLVVLKIGLLHNSCVVFGNTSIKEMKDSARILSDKTVRNNLLRLSETSEEVRRITEIMSYEHARLQNKERKESNNKKVMVTGANGYIGAWITLKLLEEGYTVHATVRPKREEVNNPENRERYECLLAMQQLFSEERLKVFYDCDLIEVGSFREKGGFRQAINGVDYVIHSATLFQLHLNDCNAKEKLVETAIKGTQRILDLVSEHEKVQRIILTSSIYAMMGGKDFILPNEYGKRIVDEQSWNTTSTKRNDAYGYSKTEAEKVAWKWVENNPAKKLIVMNPGIVCGPSLSRHTGYESFYFLKMFLKKTSAFKRGLPNLFFYLVDVRDVALAHVKALEGEDKKGRYLLVEDDFSVKRIAKELRDNPHLKFSRSTVPNFLAILFTPRERKYFVKHNIGIQIECKNYRSKNELGIDYIHFKKSFEDWLKQLVADKIIKERRKCPR